MRRQIFDPHHQIQKIVIVGLGGTGSDVARIVARILYDMKRNNQHTPELLLIDPDRVEAKNTGRQMFSPSDIGQYKAEVVSKRLNYALGMETGWIPEAVSAKKHFSGYNSQIVISCVDNYRARQEIQKINGILIANGNHKNAGQVTLGNSNDPELISKHLDEEKVRYLPKEGLIFPSLLEPEPGVEEVPPDTRSCAELLVAGEQDLLINNWVATVAGQYVYKLLHRQPIHSFLTYINADGIGVRSLPVCREELEVYLESVNSKLTV